MKFSFNKKYTTIAVYAGLVILFAIICVSALLVHPGGLFSFWDSMVQIVKILFYALIIAYFLAPIMDFFNNRLLRFIKRKKENSALRRMTSLILTFIIFAAIITVIILFVVPRFIANIENLGKVLTNYYNSIDSLIENLRHSSEFFNSIYSIIVSNSSGTEVSASELLDNALEYLINLISNASSYIISFITTFVNEVRIIFLGILLSVYFVYYKEVLIGQIKRFTKAFFRPNTRAFLAHLVEDIDIKFAKFLRGKAVDSTMVAIVLYIIYKIVGMPYAEIFAVIGGVMNMIPVFGPIIASFVCGFILLITAPKMLFAYIVIVVVVGVIDANFVEPKFLGDSLGLAPVWITVSVTVMGTLFGLFGMFFGVPIFAVIYTLVKEEVDRRVAQREAREEHMAALVESSAAPEALAEIIEVEPEDAVTEAENKEEN